MGDVPQRVSALLEECTRPDAGAAWLLCDRHPADAVAIALIDEDLSVVELTYGALREASERAAAGLAQLGVGPGDRVATLMGKCQELLATMLGVWRLGAVYVPLFTAFGPQAVAMRLTDTDAKVVVVDPDQRAKLDPGPDVPADAGWQIAVNGEAAGDDRALADLLASEPLASDAYAGGGDHPFVHMLTSGTTGRPKGVVHPLAYVADWLAYHEFSLGLRSDDAFWLAADPGWAYGLYGAIIAPLAMGIPSHVLCGGFSAERTFAVLRDRKITNFAAAPTVYRALRTAGLDTSGIRLRCAASAGEPLTPEVNEWAREALGATVHDHYGQTELGMVAGNHQHPDVARPIKDGSMGQALPGWTLVVLQEDADEPAPVDTLGRLAVDIPASPLMTFERYQHESGASAKISPDGRWYVTGDAARQDADGDIFFSARDDDVIIMAGYRIGPFDVESVLAQHEAVAECAVIAVPDEARGEVIEAVVVTRSGHAPSDELARELQQLVKERYAAHAYPRTVRFAPSLPKTESAKIQRVVLRRARVAELQAAAGSGAS
ncbi:MAG TPA: AMP-binding protein [Conexibacter sp.]